MAFLTLTYDTVFSIPLGGGGETSTHFHEPSRRCISRICGGGGSLSRDFLCAAVLDLCAAVFDADAASGPPSPSRAPADEGPASSAVIPSARPAAPTVRRGVPRRR